MIFRRIATATGLALAATAASCTHTASGDGTVLIGPDRVAFPDMSGYSKADQHTFEYRPTVPWYSDFTFRTADGLTCSMSNYLGPQYAHVDCTGPRSDQGSGQWEITAKRQSAATIRKLTEPEPVTTPPPNVLAPMQTLTDASDDFVCGSDGKGMTACRVGDHGFILTPSSTALF